MKPRRLGRSTAKRGRRWRRNQQSAISSQQSAKPGNPTGSGHLESGSSKSLRASLSFNDQLYDSQKRSPRSARDFACGLPLRIRVAHARKAAQKQIPRKRMLGISPAGSRSACASLTPAKRLKKNPLPPRGRKGCVWLWSASDLDLRRACNRSVDEPAGRVARQGGYCCGGFWAGGSV